MKTIPFLIAVVLVCLLAIRRHTPSAVKPACEDSLLVKTKQLQLERAMKQLRWDSIALSQRRPDTISRAELKKLLKLKQ